jgi:hypothetical protein
MFLLPTPMPARRLASESGRVFRNFINAFGQFWTGYWQSPPGL